MDKIIKSITTDLDSKSLVISIQNALNSDDPQSQLLDLLGYENLEVMSEILQNAHLFQGLDYEYHVNKDKQYYKLLIQQFSEILNIPESEATYALQRYDWNIDDAFLAYSDRTEINFFLEVQDNKEDENSQPEQVANLLIVDHEKPIKQFINRQSELDLHGYQVLPAIELFKQRYCDLVVKADDGKGNIRFDVITGRGLHSEHAPLIKLHLMNLCKRHDIPFSIGAKGGIICIKIKKGMHTI